MVTFLYFVLVLCSCAVVLASTQEQLKVNSISSARVEDQTIVVGFDEDIDSDNEAVVEYQVYVAKGGKEALIDLVEFSCCKTATGACQQWQAESKLVCHGIDVELDYKVIALSREISSDGEKQHQVFLPKGMREGAALGEEYENVEMSYDQWLSFQDNALETLVNQEASNMAEMQREASTNELTDLSFAYSAAICVKLAMGAFMLSIVIIAVVRCIRVRGVVKDSEPLDAHGYTAI